MGSGFCPRLILCTIDKQLGQGKEIPLVACSVWVTWALAPRLAGLVNKGGGGETGRGARQVRYRGFGNGGRVANQDLALPIIVHTDGVEISRGPPPVSIAVISWGFMLSQGLQHVWDGRFLVTAWPTAFSCKEEPNMWHGQCVWQWYW